MFTLLLSGRSHLISDDMAQRILAALDAGRPYEWIRVEMNGEGSGSWDVAINLSQLVALVRHPAVEGMEPPFQSLRLVPTP